jgi:hypothetical protein
MGNSTTPNNAMVNSSGSNAFINKNLQQRMVKDIQAKMKLNGVQSDPNKSESPTVTESTHNQAPTAPEQQDEKLVASHTVHYKGKNSDEGGTMADRPIKDTPDLDIKAAIATGNFDGKAEAEDPQYDIDEVRETMDQLFHNGYALTRGNLRGITFVLRTRFDWEDEQVLKYAEGSDLTSRIGFQHNMGRGLLAASLVEYDDQLWEPRNHGPKEELEKMFKARLEFVMSLNTVIFEILQKKMREMDEKNTYIINNLEKLSEDFS